MLTSIPTDNPRCHLLQVVNGSKSTGKREGVLQMVRCDVNARI